MLIQFLRSTPPTMLLLFKLRRGIADFQHLPQNSQGSASWLACSTQLDVLVPFTEDSRQYRIQTNRHYHLLSLPSIPAADSEGSLACYVTSVNVSLPTSQSRQLTENGWFKLDVWRGGGGDEVELHTASEKDGAYVPLKNWLATNLKFSFWLRQSTNFATFTVYHIFKRFGLNI